MSHDVDYSMARRIAEHIKEMSLNAHESLFRTRELFIRVWVAGREVYNWRDSVNEETFEEAISQLKL